MPQRKVKLSGEQRAVIVENDPVAQSKLIKLWAQVKTGEVTPEKARRLNSHIEGWAIERWRVSCLQRGEPLSSAAFKLLMQTQESASPNCSASSGPSTSQKVETKRGSHTGSCQ